MGSITGQKHRTECTIVITVNLISCPGIILHTSDYIYLRLIIFKQHTHTNAVPAWFPLVYHETFSFRKEIDCSNEVHIKKILLDEKVRFELIQIDDEDEIILLAYFETNVQDFLFKPEQLRPNYTQFDREVLLKTTKYFEGVLAPKLEYSCGVTFSGLEDLKIQKELKKKPTVFRNDTRCEFCSKTPKHHFNSDPFLVGKPSSKFNRSSSMHRIRPPHTPTKRNCSPLSQKIIKSPVTPQEVPVKVPELDAQDQPPVEEYKVVPAAVCLVCKLYYETFGRHYPEHCQGYHPTLQSTSNIHKHDILDSAMREFALLKLNSQQKQDGDELQRTGTGSIPDHSSSDEEKSFVKSKIIINGRPVEEREEMKISRVHRPKKSPDIIRSKSDGDTLSKHKIEAEKPQQEIPLATASERLIPVRRETEKPQNPTFNAGLTSLDADWKDRPKRQLHEYNVCPYEYIPEYGNQFTNKNPPEVLYTNARKDTARALFDKSKLHPLDWAPRRAVSRKDMLVHSKRGRKQWRSKQVLEDRKSNTWCKSKSKDHHNTSLTTKKACKVVDFMRKAFDEALDGILTNNVS